MGTRIASAAADASRKKRISTDFGSLKRSVLLKRNLNHKKNLRQSAESFLIRVPIKQRKSIWAVWIFTEINRTKICGNPLNPF
jgi:hypothetical protein